MENPRTLILAVLCIVFGVCVNSTIDANLRSPGASPLGNERSDRNHALTNKNQSIIRRNHMKTLGNPPNNANSIAHGTANIIAHGTANSIAHGTANSIAHGTANSNSSNKNDANITSNGTSKVYNINNKINGTENTLDGKSTGQSANRKMEEGRRDSKMRKDGLLVQNQKPTMNIFKMDGDGMYKSVLEEGDAFIATCWAWEDIGYDKKFHIYNGSEEIPCKDMRIANKMGRRLCTRNDLTVSRSDNGGLWYCVAVMDEKPYSASQITQLNVLFNTIDIFLTTTHHHLNSIGAVEVGEEVNLTCMTGSANPAPRIQWLSGDQPIRPSDVYRIEEYEADGDYRGKYTTSTLRFVAQPQHLNQTYDCAIADNVQVRARKKRNVKRATDGKATKITITGYNGPLQVGNTLNLECTSSLASFKKFVWTVSELDPPKHFKVITHTPDLEINNMDIEDTGWYMCTAYRGQGRRAKQGRGKIFVRVLSNDSSIDYPEFPKTQPQVLSEENSKLATLGGGIMAIFFVVFLSIGLFITWKKRRAPDQELLR